jgi:hypothetical protein
MVIAVSNGAAAPPRAVGIDFLYLDLETCTRCRGTDANLEAALSQLERVLGAAGVEVSVRKTLVDSADQAQALGFVSSPTIRVNGRDIALELRESRCAECGEACGCDGAIDCRVWVWQDREYTGAPTPMIVDAILREVYGGAARTSVSAPVAEASENLMRFFDGKAKHGAVLAECCSAAEQAACCEPTEKASCCGDASDGGCGCK